MSFATRFAGLRAILSFDNWPMLVLGRLFERKTGLVVYRKNGCEILIDHLGGDECGTRECITSGMYRRYLPLLKLAQPIWVLDLGANGGGFPLSLCIDGIKAARVVAVEMNPQTYARLRVNLSTNLPCTAIAINAAVCGLPPNTEIRLQANRGGTSNSMYSGSTDPSMLQEVVPTTTLQALYDRYFEDRLIDICKIDIEGAEYELFESSSDDLLRKIRYLFIEFHDPARTPDLLRKIKSLGFTELNGDAKNGRAKYRNVHAFCGPRA